MFTAQFEKRLNGYGGYIKEWVPKIRELLDQRIEKAELLDHLIEKGAGKEYPYDILRITLKSLLKEPIYYEWHKPRIFYAGRSWLRTRPVDMGGVRDAWHHWDLEKQYAEFKYVRAEG